MRKFIYLFLSVFLVFSSISSSYANTSLGGWTALDVITAGATNTINAAKGAGSSALKSSAVVTANAGKVGKHLIKGGGSVALAYAMVELADGALDWVLDPANNRVIVKGVATDNPPDTVVCESYKQIGGKELSAGTPLASCQAAVSPSPTGSSIIAFPQQGFPPRFGCRYSDSHPASVLAVVQCVNPTTPPLVTPDKYIPIDTVAAKVISNAAAGHAPSQETVKAVALEQFVAGELDAELEANAVPDTGTGTGTGTGDGTGTGTGNPPDTKPIPFDPSSIIAAINALGAKISSGFSSLLAAVGVTNTKLDEVVVAENATTEAVKVGTAEVVAAENKTTSKLDEIKTMISDFFSSDELPDPELMDGDIPIIPSDEPIHEGVLERLYIDMPSQCPSDPVLEFMGARIPFPMSVFCQFASMMKPLILLFAYIKGLSIVGSGLS